MSDHLKAPRIYSRPLNTVFQGSASGPYTLYNLVMCKWNWTKCAYSVRSIIVWPYFKMSEHFSVWSDTLSGQLWTVFSDFAHFPWVRSPAHVIVQLMIQPRYLQWSQLNTDFLKVLFPLCWRLHFSGFSVSDMIGRCDAERVICLWRPTSPKSDVWLPLVWWTKYPHLGHIRRWE